MADEDRKKTSAEIAEALRRRILSGEYGPGAKLPSVRELMTTHGVASMTVDRAIRELESEGLLTLRRGRRTGGTFVRRRIVVPRHPIRGLWVEYDRALKGDTSGGILEVTAGVDGVEVEISYDIGPAVPKAADLLELDDPDTPVLIRSFDYTIHGEPYQRGRSYMPLHIAEQIGLRSPADEPVGTTTTLQLYRGGITVEYADLLIEARPPTAEESKALAIPRGTAVNEYHRTFYVEDRPVETSITVAPGDRVAYKFRVNFKEGRRP